MDLPQEAIGPASQGRSIPEYYRGGVPDTLSPHSVSAYGDDCLSASIPNGYLSSHCWALARAHGYTLGRGLSKSWQHASE